MIEIRARTGGFKIRNREQRKKAPGKLISKKKKKKRKLVRLENGERISDLMECLVSRVCEVNSVCSKKKRSKKVVLCFWT